MAESGEKVSMGVWGCADVTSACVYSVHTRLGYVGFFYVHTAGGFGFHVVLRFDGDLPLSQAQPIPQAIFTSSKQPTVVVVSWWWLLALHDHSHL